MTDTLEASAVIVVGSINLDESLRVVRHPRPGETVVASSVSLGLGGKGANQAVAAAATGARVAMVGTVGDDAAGSEVTEALRRRGVDVRGLTADATSSTGRAQIAIDESGENTIVVFAGANDRLTGEMAAKALGSLTNGRSPAIMLCQGEISPATIDAVAESCRELQTRLVLNLAPVVTLKPETLALADPLIVNEVEASQLVGHLGTRSNGYEWALFAVRTLASISKSAVITLGELGAVGAERGVVWHQAGVQVERVVDTTGAGDALVGTVAAILAAGEDLGTALRYGVAAGCLAVTVEGADGFVKVSPQLATVYRSLPMPERNAC